MLPSAIVVQADPPAPINDPDDQISEATPAQIGVTISGEINRAGLIDAADVDMYQLTLDAATILSLDIDSYGRFDSLIALFDETGHRLAWNDEGGAPGESPIHDSYLTYNITQAGDYYVAVTGWPNGYYSSFDAVTGTGDRWPSWGPSQGPYELVIGSVAGPRLQLPAGEPTYVQGGNPVAVDPDAIFSDPNPPHFGSSSLNVSIQSAGVGDRLLLVSSDEAGHIKLVDRDVQWNGTSIGTYKGSTDGSFNIRFNANATADSIQQLIRQTAYVNTRAHHPALPDRQIAFQFDDGYTGNTGPVLKTLHFISREPQILGFGGTVNAVEGAGPRLLDYDATITDADSSSFAGGQLLIRIESNAEEGDRLLIAPEGNSAGKIGLNGFDVTYGGVVIGRFNGGVGNSRLQIVFNANASTQAVQRLLQRIAYQTVTNTPSTLPRTVRVSLTDGDGFSSEIARKQLTVAAIANEVEIDAFGWQVTYSQGTSPILIDYDTTLTGPDGVLFAGGQLFVQLVANASEGDQLSILSHGNGAGQISILGTEVRYAGAAIGQFAGGVDGEPLIVTFNGNATLTAVQALLRRIGFSNVSATPSTEPRTVQATIIDGNGFSSLPARKTIIVTT